MEQTADHAVTREEWAARTAGARRRARYSALLARARLDVSKDSLPLTAAEWAAIAEVYLEAAREAAA